MEKYVRARQDKDDNIIRRMRLSCCMTNATNTTHSEYVILTAFLQQQWLSERSSVVYVIRTVPITCPFPPVERPDHSFSRHIFSLSVCCSTPLVTPVSSVSIVTSLRAEHPRNRISILDSSRHIYLLSKASGPSSAPPAVS